MSVRKLRIIMILYYLGYCHLQEVHRKCWPSLITNHCRFFIVQYYMHLIVTLLWYFVFIEHFSMFVIKFETYCNFLKYSDTQKNLNYVVLPQSNESKRCRRNGKQCRPWSDFSSRSSLIWVCTVCPGISVRKLRIITVMFYLLFDFIWHLHTFFSFNYCLFCLFVLFVSIV